MIHRGRANPALLIVVAAVAAGLGLWLGGRNAATPPADDVIIRYPTPEEVPSFQLQTANGKVLTDEDWRGQWDLVFFGFTHCPDVCPAAMQAIAQATQEMDSPPGVTLVSVDPDRDTPGRVSEYARFFDERFHGATATHAELEALTRQLGVIYHIGEPDESGAYDVDHSASILVVDPEGRLAGLIRPPYRPEAIRRALENLPG